MSLTIHHIITELAAIQQERAATFPDLIASGALSKEEANTRFLRMQKARLELMWFVIDDFELKYQKQLHVIHIQRAIQECEEEAARTSGHRNECLTKAVEYLRVIAEGSISYFKELVRTEGSHPTRQVARPY